MSLNAAERLSVLALTIVGMVLPSPTEGFSEQGRATLGYTFYVTSVAAEVEEEEVVLTVTVPCPTFGSEISDTITTTSASDFYRYPSRSASDKIARAPASDKRYCR